MLAAADRIATLPDPTPTEALLHLADKLTEVIAVNLDLLMQDDSPEPVHKARVALRRFRAMLDAFDPILDDDLSDALHDRARALFRVLGAIRDADVMRSVLPGPTAPARPKRRRRISGQRAARH